LKRYHAGANFATPSAAVNHRSAHGLRFDIIEATLYALVKLAGSLMHEKPRDLGQQRMLASLQLFVFLRKFSHEVRGSLPRRSPSHPLSVQLVPCANDVCDAPRKAACFPRSGAFGDFHTSLRITVLGPSTCGNTKRKHGSNLLLCISKHDVDADSLMVERMRGAIFESTEPAEDDHRAAHFGLVEGALSNADPRWTFFFFWYGCLAL
jgi:hypothetical protein